MSQQVVALDFLARCLRADCTLDTIGPIRSDITLGHISWETVIGLANDHLVSPALWVALRDKELLEYLPADLCEYLHTLYRLNKHRNDHLREQLIEAIHQLNAVGIEPLILKGAAHLLTDIYHDQAVRIMTDLDILVSEQEIIPCLEALHGLGYRAYTSQKKFNFMDHHHCAPLGRPGDWGTIEVHRELLFHTAQRILPTKTAWAHTQTLEINRIKAKILSPTYLILHNILHSQVVDRKYEQGLINLRSLHEVASINDRYGTTINWAVIQKLMDRYRQGRMLRSYLYLAHRLLGMDMPEGIQPGIIGVIYYQRVQARLRWPWAQSWDRKIQRFSAYHICRRYGYENNLVWLTMGRLRYTGYLLSKYGRKVLPKQQ